MRSAIRPLSLFPLLIIMIAAMVLAIGSTAIAAEGAAKPEVTSPFKDVTSNDSNRIFISYINQLGIIKGFPDGSFKPKEGMTRAQAATVICKAAGLQTPAIDKSGFADVRTDHWAAPSIAAAAKAGYIKGYPDGNYHPEEKLTRVQGISLIMRLSSQKEQAALPSLSDLNKDHWAAANMGTALALEMIGLSPDGKNIYPEAVMTRGSLARALGTLLTKDPGLYTKILTGTIKEIKGEIKLNRAGTTTVLQNDARVYKGDIITAGVNSTGTLMYPDGSSVLIKENSELQIKESIGRAYIKQDGSSGIAVDNLEIEMKRGTLFGALASNQETSSQEKQSARAGETLVASLDGLGNIADSSNSKTPPWYQQAEAKKVKMKVDMPYGVAAIRGTFFLVTVNWDAQGNIVSCDVSCLTGDLAVNQTNLSEGTSSTVNKEGKASESGPLTEEAKQKLTEAAVQQWAVDTALQMEQNKEGKAGMILEVPDSAATPAEQEVNILDLVLKAFESSGVKIDQTVKDKLKDMKQQLSEQVQKTLETPNTPQPTSPPAGGGSGASEESTVNYINYAAPDKTYGPESAADTQTISKNIIISAPGITLKNVIITKDLTLAAGIGDGSVTLINVKVQGNTNVLGGGLDSVILEDCELYTVFVDNKTNTVRIVAKGSSTVGALTLNSGVKLEEEPGLSGSGFSSVTTGTGIPAEATIILIGNFAEVNIESPGLSIQVEEGSSIEQMNIAQAASGTNLNLAPGTSVSTLQINAQANIGGSGQIITAAINAAGVEMAQLPQNWTVAPGINDALIGGEIREGSGSSNNAAVGSAAASEGTHIIIYTLTTGTFDSVAGAVYANWTMAGTNAADLGAITNVALSAENTVASITVTNPIGASNKVYTLAPAQAALSAGFTAPAAVTVIISDAVDVSAPVFAGSYPKAGTAQAAGSKTVEILLKVNEIGTAYYVVVADGAPPPSAAQVMAGQDSSGAAALTSANAAVSANSEKSFVTAALAADATAYDIYIVVKDGANNATPATKVDVSTPAAPLLDLSGTGVNVLAGNITGTETTMEYSSDSSNGSDGNWTACAAGNTEVSFAAGKVYVREAAHPSNFHLVATIAAAAGAPTVSLDNDTSATAVFKKSADGSGVSVAAADGYEFSLNGTTWNPILDTTTADASANASITVRVAATAAAFASAASADLDKTGVGTFACTSRTDENATFTWTAADGASDVKIQQKISSESTWADATTEETLDSTSTTATVTGLTASTAYDLKLVVTGGTYAGDSNVVTITTLSEQQAAINYVNAAAGKLGWDYPPDVVILNAATGESNAIPGNESAYLAAVETAPANSLDTAEKIQHVVNQVNVAEAKGVLGNTSLTCTDLGADPVTLALPADLTDESEVTFAFTAQDEKVSIVISGSSAVITRSASYGGTVLTVTVTCATGGQTASDTKVYVVKVPSSGSITWGQPAPEPAGYTVAPGTAHPGTPGGTSSITYTSGYNLFYTLKPGFILPPIADEDSSSYIEGLTPYTSGEDITGAVYGNHLGLYEINTGNNQVVTFVDIILGANDIEAGAGGLAAPGITGFTLEDNPPSNFIKVTYTAAAGNSLRYVKQTSAFETPAINAAAPAIGSNPGEATEYTSGDTITIDRSTDYIGLYEVNASSQVVRFVDVIFKRPT